MLRRGRLIAVPPPDVAERFLAAEGDGLSIRRRTIVGTPAQVRAGIEEAAAEYGAEEVIVVTITYDHGARRRSYELIAGEFGAQRRRRPAPRRSALSSAPPSTARRCRGGCAAVADTLDGRDPAARRCAARR